MILKCENLQRTGSFKIRGALNAVLALSEDEAARGVVTASSGNFGQAVACAAKLRGIQAHIVMPRDAARVKLRAVESFGGQVHQCAPTLRERDATLDRVRAQTAATFICSHNDSNVIAGQGTVASELLAQAPDIDAIIAPIGGGGLISGAAIVAKTLNPSIRVIGAEPDGADDAARSKAAGRLIVEDNPQTVAKGLLVGLGDLTWPIVRDLVDDIITVSDDETIKAMRLVWNRLKLIVEPSAAVAVAAALSERFHETGVYRKVAIVLSGGNVDLRRLPVKH